MSPVRKMTCRAARTALPGAWFVCLALAACGEERGLPEGFLERAASDTPPATAAAPAAASQTDAIPMSEPASADDAPNTPADAAPAIALGPSADDPAVTAAADAHTEQLVQGVVKELQLPPAPAPQTMGGDEPFQRLAREARFDSFRAQCARFIQLRTALLPLGERLAAGTATPEERARHNRIEAAANAEQLRLMRFLWRDGRSEQDRAVMSWIMFGPISAPRGKR